MGHGPKAEERPHMSYELRLFCSTRDVKAICLLHISGSEGLGWRLQVPGRSAEHDAL